MKTGFKIPVLMIVSLLAVYPLRAQSVVDTITFETPSASIVVDTAGGNLWQTGRPQKVFFSSAHSGTRAILTDTVAAYPAGDTSSFNCIIREQFMQSCLTCLSYWHKYDMDSLEDKGLVEASYDGGNSWLLLKDTMFWGAWFAWRDDYHETGGTYAPHQLNTTGTSDGWVQSTFCWQWWLPVKQDTIILFPDSLMVRFTFISGSTVHGHEGWMIDDMVMYDADPWGCSGVPENGPKALVTLTPNPFTTTAVFQVSGAFQQGTLRIFDASGRCVREMNGLNGPQILLQRESLKAGMYYYFLTAENAFLSRGKIVVAD